MLRDFEDAGGLISYKTEVDFLKIMEVVTCFTLKTQNIK